ncbi:putative DNA polymerase, partial [Frankliniella fusca]
EILAEWGGGSFYNDQYLSEAYTQMLLALMNASPNDRADPRIVPFLLVGFLAYQRVQEGADPQALLTFRMALAMVGQGSPDPPNHPAAPPVQSGPPSPQPGPSRPPSPQPGDKRPLEEVGEAEQPTLEVLQSRERHLKRFKTTFREEVVQIKGLGESLPSDQLMEEMFDTVLARQRDAVHAKDDDRVILEIESSENADNAVWFSLRKTSQINGRIVLDKLTRVLNSNQSFMADGRLKISYIHVKTPEAGGRRTNVAPNESMDQWLQRMINRKAIYSPDNNDNMCLTRSVAVAMGYYSMNKLTFFRFKNNERAQKKAAQKLCDDAQIDPTLPCGIDEIQKLQDSLPEHRLCVFTDKKETTQDTPVPGKEETYEHKPNLLVCQAVCDQCIGVKQNDFFCNVCKTRQHVFHNLDDPNVSVMGQFFDYLQSFGAKTEILAVAHNSKAFDSIFALQEIIARKLKPELTLAGAKIICMKVGNWKFIDSLSFMPMALSAMPKAFGLTELKKGYWPFLANKPEYYNYEGPLLPKDLYCISTMKSRAAAEFHAWHDGQVHNNYVFNFRKEFVEYCISDVTILREACTAFRKIYQEVAGYDPMFNCITLSSACMSAFRRNFLQKDTIGIVPPGGYHGRGKQSHIALQWLDFEAHKIGQVIKTIYTDREVSVMGRHVDGYVEFQHDDGHTIKRIYQFHGCYWHQCPTHFPATEGDSENRYVNTQKITEMFRENGFEVIEKWECDFKRELTSDPATKAFFEQHPTVRVTPLHLRDALCGGRTSALKWYHKADLDKGEKIKMVDVISEYPNANLRGEFPYGHPQIFLEGDPNMPPFDQWNGVIKCTVLPPRELYIPILPLKTQGRLMFPLCRTCAEQGCSEICRHTPEDRKFTDTWCVPELKLAVQKGYVIMSVHEVYQYPGTKQYNPLTQEDGLLSGYIRCFMALKMQASGWPADCTTDELKAQFIKDTLKHDGVDLDPSKMEKNPALRTLSKLMCNAFWGKFGEKTLRPKTELIFQNEKLISMMADPKITITGLLPLSDECIQVKWEPISDTEESLPTSSLILAAFTTCLGRLQLYHYLDQVNERALYCDTDSVAYISRPGEPDIPTGTHLGDLTDQVEEDHGPGSFITEFVAGGPKNYAFKVAVGGDLSNIKVCIKVRGISINASCDELVTFDNLKAMVMGSRDKITVPIPHQIARLPTWQIVTRASHKNWKPVNIKRRRVDVANTVPHGFNAWDMAEEEDQDLLEAMELLADA